MQLPQRLTQIRRYDRKDLGAVLVLPRRAKVVAGGQNMVVGRVHDEDGDGRRVGCELADSAVLWRLHLPDHAVGKPLVPPPVLHLDEDGCVGRNIDVGEVDRHRELAPISPGVFDHDLNSPTRDFDALREVQCGHIRVIALERTGLAERRTR